MNLHFLKITECATAMITASIFVSSFGNGFAPKCSITDSGSRGSYQYTSTSYSLSSCTIFSTDNSRISATSSLYVRPIIRTRDPLIVFPTLFNPLTAISATYFGIESLIERPARMTCGWQPQRFPGIRDKVVGVYEDTPPDVLLSLC